MVKITRVTNPKTIGRNKKGKVFSNKDQELDTKSMTGLVLKNDRICGRLEKISIIRTITAARSLFWGPRFSVAI